MFINLRFTPEQFSVIYEFLYHTRLGNRNIYEDAISELMIKLENDGAEELVNLVKEDYGNFTINVEFNQDDGMTFSLLTNGQ
jgi:hypothetical protein